jgi:hypothetical protein
LRFWTMATKCPSSLNCSYLFSLQCTSEVCHKRTVMMSASATAKAPSRDAIRDQRLSLSSFHSYIPISAALPHYGPPLLSSIYILEKPHFLCSQKSPAYMLLREVSLLFSVPSPYFGASSSSINASRVLSLCHTSACFL